MTAGSGSGSGSAGPVRYTLTLEFGEEQAASVLRMLAGLRVPEVRILNVKRSAPGDCPAGTGAGPETAAEAPAGQVGTRVGFGSSGLSHGDWVYVSRNDGGPHVLGRVIGQMSSHRDPAYKVLTVLGYFVYRIVENIDKIAPVTTAERKKWADAVFSSPDFEKLNAHANWEK